jgi:hypothetical protein
MFACFGLAIISHVTTALVGWGVIRMGPSGSVARNLLPVGSALWLISFVLAFFVSYYQSQLGEPPDDDNAG